MRSYLKSELLYALEHHLESATFEDMLKAIVDLGLTITLFSDEQGLLNVRVTSEAEKQDECNECVGCVCEAETETPNPFIEQHEQEHAEMAKLGLSDFPYHEQINVIRKAKKHIEEHKIEDENEKVKTHHMMRDHYIAYKEYLNDR